MNENDMRRLELIIQLTLAHSSLDDSSPKLKAVLEGLILHLIGERWNQISARLTEAV